MRTGNSSSAKRIQKELAEISLDPPCNCSAGPKGDNIYEWVSTIMGPSGGCRPNVLRVVSGSCTARCQHGLHPVASVLAILRPCTGITCAEEECSYG